MHYWLLVVLLFLSGCATQGKISNIAGLPTYGEKESYGFGRIGNNSTQDDFAVILAFSGGGSRAAAMSYGVLEALRDTDLMIEGRAGRLLDEVDVITSVSGGSFTAAYFGLHGDRIFSDYEKRFLRRDVASELLSRILSPRSWFSEHGRTETAISYYEKVLFDGATFADLNRADGPFIIINSSDLGAGIRFAFTQNYFSLLCSDISSYPVARAVTASSAVPVLFNPVVLKNYQDCPPPSPFIQAVADHTGQSHQTRHLLDGLSSYADKKQRPYIHLVDGGITDNLGLLALYETVDAAGGIRELFGEIRGAPVASKLLVISVNASTRPQYELEQSKSPPGVEQFMGAVTDIQLHRYNAATMDLLNTALQDWAQELSDETREVEHYFVELDFNQVTDEEQRFFLNQIPTTFSLTGKQVDGAIEAGRELLLANREYLRFLDDIQ
ncbi:patatin-like phospholipase family protein [Desulfosediminicola sp.]|uniref:patatin-like phospholipase family protein n=1 Tax=Desulfosediminicola sp. TaxID=2886825 RepID=UPI003AF28B6F